MKCDFIIWSICHFDSLTFHAFSSYVIKKIGRDNSNGETQFSGHIQRNLDVFSDLSLFRSLKKGKLQIFCSLNKAMYEADPTNCRSYLSSD